jgi:pimeloyl-ACP methyl ester carboxylesterase
VKQFRKYGEKPFDVVLVHGGPGAAGELEPLALRLSERFGVIEALQTKKSIKEQAEELYSTILKSSNAPVDLIGFSWGAWLSIIVTSQHNTLVRKLILISSGPIEQKYAHQVYSARLGRLKSKDRERFKQIVTELERNSIVNTVEAQLELGRILCSTDAFDPISAPDEKYELNTEVYQSIWPEASALRESGRLLEMVKHITCPVIAIHGDYDPHPVQGIIEPLSLLLNDFTYHILDSCGHKPWIEKYASKMFYQLLINCLMA